MLSVSAAELADLAGGVGAEELDRAKAQLRASLVMARESVAGSGEALARQVTLFGAPVDDADVLDGIAAIDANMVSAVAGEMIATDAPVIAAVGPDSGILDNAALADRLAGRT
jgi:processing peptidase subunit beta